MLTPRAVCEFPAGLAAVSLRLHGGRHCRPPISRMGNKQGYAEVILDALGLRSGQGAGAYLWAEADPDVRALLRAYPDAAMLTRIAEIIRGWADEEPRALWERLRAERKARGPAVEPDVAGWMVTADWAYRQGSPESGFNPSVATGVAYNAGPAVWSARCTTLAAYATIAASNRLINVAGPELMNTGAGGTTFGGAEFATPAGDVAAGFERVAGWVFLAQTHHEAGTLQGGFVHPEEGGRYGAGRVETAARIEARIASRWPPVAVLATIPSAADVAAWLGTPGDLSGVVVYADPPYAGTTGYGSNLTRDEVIAYALDFDRLGAVVCISEAEPVIDTWYATEITGGRKGQKRTFSKQQREWLTMNRPPAATVAEQVGLFG